MATRASTLGATASVEMAAGVGPSGEVVVPLLGADGRPDIHDAVTLFLERGSNGLRERI